jgi:hypothetical protein
MSLSERDAFLVETLARYAFYENIKEKGVIDQESFKNLLMRTFDTEQMEIIQYFLREHAQHVQATSAFIDSLREK